MQSTAIGYAKYASAGFNGRFHSMLKRLSSDVREALGSNFQALVLGGGYGRGEGGVVRIDGLEYPYNDLDLMVIVKKKSESISGKLGGIRRKYGKKLRIEVEFGRPLTDQTISQWPREMMWFDLIHGHRVLSGPNDCLSKYFPAWREVNLPAVEATRLLLNRGAGLLWALRVVRNVEPPPDKDFVRRNFHKCVLSLGDALLILEKKYTPFSEERALLLEELTNRNGDGAWLGLARMYGEASRFKYQPDLASSGEFSEEELGSVADEWGRIFLYVERYRLKREWKSLAEYSRWGGFREPDKNTPGQWIKNVCRNLSQGCGSTRYPSEKLYRRLPFLLGLADPPVHDWVRESEQFLNTWRKWN